MESPGTVAGMLLEWKRPGRWFYSAFNYMVAADTTFFFTGESSLTLITIFGTGISKKQM